MKKVKLIRKNVNSNITIIIAANCNSICNCAPMPVETIASSGRYDMGYKLK